MHVFQLPSLLKCLLSPVTTLIGTGSLNSLEFKCKGKPAHLCSQCPLLLSSLGTQGQAPVITPCSVGSQGLVLARNMWALVIGVTSGGDRAASFLEWVLHVWNISFCCAGLRSGGCCLLQHGLGFLRLMLKPLHFSYSSLCSEVRIKQAEL